MKIFTVSVELYATSFSTRPRSRRIFPIPLNIANSLLEKGVLDDLVRSAFFMNRNVRSVTRVSYNSATHRIQFGIQATLSAREIANLMRGAPYEDTVFESSLSVFKLNGVEFVPDIRQKTALHIRRVRTHSGTFIKQRDWYSD